MNAIGTMNAESVRLLGGPARPEALLGPARAGADARKTAEEFAGLFYGMMLREMEKTVPKNEYFGGRGEEIFRSLWVDELAGQMAGRKNDPLAKAIYSEMTRHGGAALRGEKG